MVKSEAGSANRRWAASAASCFSAGRSRGSWIDSAAAITSTSCRQPLRSASSTIRPSRGSIGSWASFRPISVRACRSLQRAQLVEQGDAVGDRAPVRRVEERERADVAEPERGHLQDHRGQVGPLDLRLGEPGPGLEVLLGVEPDADAVGGTPAAALALVGAGLRDRLDRQPLHLGPGAVAGDPRGAGIDHVPDAGHGQRGLGDVGGQHDPPAGVRREHLVLLGRRQPGVQRQHLGAVRQRAGAAPPRCRGSRARRTGRPARRRAPPGRARRTAAVIGLRSGRPPSCRRAGSGPPPGTCGRTPRRTGAPPKCSANRCRVDRRRGDDQLEVGPARQQLLEVAEQEVDVEAALVRLVDDQRVVPAQHPVVLDLGQQDAVGHHLDRGVLAGPVGEPDLVADRAAELDAELLGDPLGDRAGGDPARLGVPDQRRARRGRARGRSWAAGWSCPSRSRRRRRRPGGPGSRPGCRPCGR